MVFDRVELSEWRRGILKDKLHFFFYCCIARFESGVGNSSPGPC